MILDRTGGEPLLECFPDAAVLVDAEGKIVLCNQMTEMLFGYATGELVGQSIEVLMPERFRGPHVEQRRQYTHHPTTRQMGRGLDLLGRRKDGVEFPVDIMLKPLEENGRRQVLAVIRDISERKQAEEALRREKEQLEQVNKVMMNREGRILELKRQVNELLTELGRPSQYGV